MALALLVALLSAATAGTARAIEPADPEATAETRNLLANLDAIRGEKLIFGHHMTSHFRITRPPADASRWSDVKAATGEWPGMWSFQMNFATKYGKADQMRESIRFAHAQGSPVTMCWHMAYPVPDTRAGAAEVDVPSVLPGGANHALLVEQLSAGADYLATLTDAGGRPIPILMRPWHEFNLKGPWWGKATPEEFVRLYRFTVDYYRTTRGLHNLLYVYNPNWRPAMAQGDIEANLLGRYPGDDYVDVLSMDYYGDIPRAGVPEVLRTIVTVAEERGKLPAYHEGGVGIGRGYAKRNADPDWYADLLNMLKDDPVARRIPYITTWYNKRGHYWVPYAEVVNGYDAFMEFYRDPYTAFGDDVREMKLYDSRDEGPAPAPREAP